jgi:hypothetical protein
VEGSHQAVKSAAKRAKKGSVHLLDDRDRLVHEG